MSLGAAPDRARTSLEDPLANVFEVIEVQIGQGADINRIVQEPDFLDKE